MNDKKWLESWREQWNLFLWVVFDLMHDFYSQYPEKLGNFDLNDCFSALELLSESGLSALDTWEMLLIHELFTSDFRLFCAGQLPNNKGLQAGFVYFNELSNQVSKILPEMYRRLLQEALALPQEYVRNFSVKKDLKEILLFSKQILKQALEEYQFKIRGEFLFQNIPIMLVNTPDGNYHFVSYESSAHDGIKKTFNECKIILFGQNKLYKFVKKSDWKREKVLQLAGEYRESLSASYVYDEDNEQPQVSMLDFFSTFMPNDVLKRLKWMNFELLPFNENSISELVYILPQLNTLGFQNEQNFLFVEDAKHELSFIGNWRYVSPHQRAKNWLYDKEAIFFWSPRF